ncbi:MAG TPA: NADPH-dependent FMN reductase [Rhodospirillaceae bacterium]|nr:NADPH-dependent FMN reductase [Rhodospirillaceae bacterium]
MPNIAIVYHSGYGHTAVLAVSVRDGALRVPGTTVDLIQVEDIEAHWQTLKKADAIIFGAPTYMASASAPFKAFMDATSPLWSRQEWKDKLAAGFTNSGSQNGDKLNTLVEMMLFSMQHSMIWIGLGLLPGNNSSKGSIDDLNRLGSYAGAMSQSNNDQGPDLTPPESDHKTAAYLGERVAKMASRMKD